MVAVVAICVVVDSGGIVDGVCSCVEVAAEFELAASVDVNGMVADNMIEMTSDGRVMKLVLFARVSGMGFSLSKVVSAFSDLTGASITDTVRLNDPVAELEVLHLVIRTIGGAKLPSASKISF